MALGTSSPSILTLQELWADELVPFCLATVGHTTPSEADFDGKCLLIWRNVIILPGN